MTTPEPSSKVTLSQVAEEAGVSVMTASYTYNMPSRVSAVSRDKVLRAAEALGYAGPDPSARSLRRGTSGALGVVLGETLAYAFDDPQATRFLAGIADVCADHGLAMTILPATGSADDGQRIRAAAVDAFIVWTTTDDDPILEALALTSRPVTIHAGPARKPFNLVGIDDRAAARAVAAQGLRGAQRPAIISFPFNKTRERTVAFGPDPAHVGYPVTRHRLQGYQDSSTTAGIPWGDIEAITCSVNSFSEGVRAGELLLSRPTPPDTILAMSDELALGVLTAAATAGVNIPKRLAVTGWDASDAALAQHLTTVHQDLRQQGVACAKTAITGISTPTPQPWDIIIGHTTR